MVDEEFKRNKKGKRNLDRSNRLEMLFGKKNVINPFHRPSREISKEAARKLSNSSLQYTPFKGTFRTDPPANKQGWTSIQS